MKLTPRLIAVLKNFSSINKSILVYPGNKLKTMASNQTILAEADIDVEFPQEFALYDLSRFLTVVSLFNEPELEFHEKYVEISSNSQAFRYTYCSPKSIVVPDKNKKIVLPEPFIQLSISQEMLSSTLKAASVLQASDIAVVAEHGKLFLKAIDTKNSSSDTFSIEIGKSDKTATFIFKAEFLKLIPDLYHVTICLGAKNKIISHFKGEMQQYWIAVSENSTYENE